MNIVKIFSHLFKIWIYHWVPVCNFSGVLVTTKCADSWDLLSRAFPKSEVDLLPDLFILAWPKWLEWLLSRRSCSILTQGLQCPPSSGEKKIKRAQPTFYLMLQHFLAMSWEQLLRQQPISGSISLLGVQPQTRTISWNFIPGKEPKSSLLLKRSFPGLCQWRLCKLAEI